MAEKTETNSAGMTSSRKGLLALGVAVAIAAGAIGYRALTGDGAQQSEQSLQDGPLSLEQLEARAAADPMDAASWQELGYTYFNMGRFADAARAYRQAVEGAPENAAIWSALGEARVMASERDPMPAEAVTAFEKAIDLDPADPRARYFLAVRKDLSGDHDGALADWIALLKETPAGAPWEADLKRTIEQVAAIHEVDVSADVEQALAGRPEPAPLIAGDAIPGPTQRQIAEAGTLRPSEQRDMAVGMVESLEGKLRANPSNVDGWVMLMRSRMTLGEPAKAAKALRDAIAANPGSADRLRQEADLLGVPKR
jgi:cytochrome c-type biogenesis protein CcmH